MNEQETGGKPATYNESEDKRMIETVVMSGGAPQSPLMAGFLHALWTRNKTFLKFHTSGAGALMALLFISPKGKDPGAALNSWVEAGIADEIYRSLPQNFKLFHKPGPFAPIYTRLAERFKVPLGGPETPESRDPVRDFMAELLVSLKSYTSPATSSLRKDPIEQIRDVWMAMWGNGMLANLDPIRRLREKWLTSWLPKDEDRRLYNDMVDLWFSALTPSTLSSKSLGMAAPLPFLEKLVDFDLLDSRIKDLDVEDPETKEKKHAHLCVNAYNMTRDARERPDRRKKREDVAGVLPARARPGAGRVKRKCEHEDDLEKVMEYFVAPSDRLGESHRSDQSPRPDHIVFHPLNAKGIRAAFSMPFIYPPAQIKDDYYSEGADHQPINFNRIDKVGEFPFALIDVLAQLEDHLVRKPRDLWDSYVISIMTPVVALAKAQIEEFKEDNPKCDECSDHWNGDMLTARWDVPPEAQPFVMDWSYSNLTTLFRVGQETGRKFVEKYEKRLYDRTWADRTEGS
jgi:hypothetical protein